MSKNILTADELAEMLGMNRATVYAAASRNEIPHKRIGKRIVFHVPTIEAWLAAGERAA